MHSDKALDIIHDDPLFVVVEKPGGLLAVPGRGPENQDCVTARVQAMFPEMIGHPAVHRLDMHTSGLMLLAKTKPAHRALSIQFEKRLVKKTYIALLEGIVDQDSGTISLPFRLDIDNRPHQIYDPIHGKMGTTIWKKIAVEKGSTRIEMIPVTGRTHQLRLHSFHTKGLGVPIIGDTLYGNGNEGDVMCLHAHFLQFFHPETEEAISCISPIPF